MAELEEFIEQVHNEPYDVLANNCIIKHARIVEKAKELGYDASFMTCLSITPVRMAGGLPIIGPHFYAEVDGELVDVTFEPCLEQVWCRNDDIVKLFPVNITKLRPYDPWRGPPLPSGYFPPWPWAKA